MAVDFDEKILGGSITHDFYTQAPTDKVVLDIWDMDIESVDYLPANAAQAMRDGVFVPTEGFPCDFKTMEINPVIG